MRFINLIVVHCSASPNGVFVSPQQVDAWHAERGFRRDAMAIERFNAALPHIGYHWLITADGRQNPGRATDEVGAHVAGYNKESIGICMTGMDRFYMAQWDALEKLICDLAFLWQTDRLLPADRAEYPFSPAQAIAQLAKMGIRIVGHRDLSPDIDGDGVIEPREWLKTCPGFDVADWLAFEMLPPEAAIYDGHPAVMSVTAAERALHA